MTKYISIAVLQIVYKVYYRYVYLNRYAILDSFKRFLEIKQI